MPRLIIARHGETVFNAAARLQGEHLHTPLTREGFSQADRMGAALREKLGASPDLDLWASDSGRALQTLAIVAERLNLDWHDASRDQRLVEIGMGSWGGRYYADVIADHGPVVDEKERLLKPAPDGESYAAIVRRVTSWLDEHGSSGKDKLIIMHGISSRVLRGVLLGLEMVPEYGAPVAGSLSQGSVVRITDGEEEVLVEGTGGERA